MKNGAFVGKVLTSDMTKDEVLGMVIFGKCPPGATLGPGALEDKTAGKLIWQVIKI